MILFCCASELGPSEDLSAIEVILYYYYYKRHFFRCSANTKIWHLEAIRRAVIFDVDFVINVVKTVTG